MTSATTDLRDETAPIDLDETDGVDSEQLADGDYDEDALTQDDGTPDVEDVVDEAGAPAQRKARRGLDRATVRRVATKMHDLSQASAERREILTALLSAPSTEPIDLTVAVMTGARSAMTPVTDLLSVADSDPLAAGITAMSLERSRMRAVWQLAAQLQLVEGAIPSADTKAALALAGALQNVDDEHRAELDAVQALARKGA